jgi:microcystin degradation protein MlrC
VTVFDERQTAPEALEHELLDMAWERRAGFVYEVEPVAESVCRAKGLDGPVILVDHGDNVFSGGTQDVMATVAEVMRQELNNVAVGPIWDPGVVATLIDAGIGARVTVQLGGKTPMPALHMGTDSLEVSGTVKRITDGRYTVTCPMMTGVTLDHGRSVVLDTGAMEILVCEQRMEPFDLGVFRHAGIEPTEKHFLLVKSRQHFRAGFEPIAKHIVLLSGPGVTSSDYSLFDFAKVPRPMYPLDPDMDPSVTRLDPGGDTEY